MNAWLQFLAEQGAQIDESNNSQVIGFGAPRSASDLSRGFVAPLTDLGLIQASGEDAAAFLHNQLTNDVEHLGSQEARLAAYCSPKGRMLASLLMWKNEGN